MWFCLRNYFFLYLDLVDVFLIIKFSDISTGHMHRIKQVQNLKLTLGKEFYICYCTFSCKYQILFLEMIEYLNNYLR